MSSHPQTQANETLPSVPRETGTCWSEPIHSFKLPLHDGFLLNKASHIAKVHIHGFYNMELQALIVFVSLKSFPIKTTFLDNGESNQYIITIN